MNLIRTGFALALAAGLSAGTIAAQQTQPPAPAPPQQERAKTPEPVTGELVSLNTETKSLIIKTAADTEMKFTYSDTTEIIGADKGVAGLATSTGANVTVTYSVHGTTNVASKIEVAKKS